MPPKKEKADPDLLETVDLEAVEILEADVRIFGVGSPPEGDLYSVDDLEAMAAAAQELEAAGEFAPPSKIGKNKLGHSKKQKLLADSGVTDGEMPAAGWVSNQRVVGTKLVADIKSVPKKVAKLLEAGAWRTRSVELGSVTSQKTEKTYDWVVTGLAWLGAKMPAVRTLDDVFALYEAEGIELAVDLQRVFAAEVVWDPDQSFESIRSKVRAALNPGPQVAGDRYWVRDIAPGKALVAEGWDYGAKTWVVAFTIAEEGTIEVSDSADWTPAEEAWIAASRDLSQEVRSIFERAADTRRQMPPLEINEEQAKDFATALGIEKPEDMTPESLLEAVKVKLEEQPAPAPAPEPKNDDDPDTRSLEQRVEAAEAKAEFASSTLKVRDKQSFSAAAIKGGKVEPGQREQLERFYEVDEEGARAFVEGLAVNQDWLKEYGSDDPGTGPDAEADSDEKLYEAWRRVRGMDVASSEAA